MTEELYEKIRNAVCIKYPSCAGCPFEHGEYSCIATDEKQGKLMRILYNAFSRANKADKKIMTENGFNMSSMEVL